MFNTSGLKRPLSEGKKRSLFRMIIKRVKSDGWA